MLVSSNFFIMLSKHNLLPKVYKIHKNTFLRVSFHFFFYVLFFQSFFSYNMAQDILLKENLNASDSEDQSSINTITDSEFDNFNQKNDNSNCEDFRNAKEIMQKNQI